MIFGGQIVPALVVKLKDILHKRRPSQRQASKIVRQPINIAIPGFSTPFHFLVTTGRGLGAGGKEQSGSCLVHYQGFGKSFRQQRPDGLLVSQEHRPALVWATTKSLVAGSRAKSALVRPKQ